MKRFFLILMGAVILNFAGCGKGSEEAKELLQKLLQVVGIPYNMVVQICQDSNADGICNITEVTAKITISKDDTAETIFKKFQLDENGKYILEHYDPKLKILMEVADNQGRFNTGKHVTLPFTPKKIVKDKPQELSILQSLVDNGFLETDAYQEITEAPKAREVIDQVLLENVFQNQQILEEHNLTAQVATNHNLEFIAEGLKELNVTSLVDDLNDCERNTTQDCREVVIQTDDRTEINKKDAVIIKDTNSTDETTHEGTTEDNNKTVVVSDDGNVTIVDDNATSSDDDNATSSDDDNATSSDDDEPVEEEKTEKNVADGYIVKLSSPAIAYCGSNEYSSSLTIGAKGNIVFDGVILPNDCHISVPSGATIDSNNNGLLDANDKTTDFEMKSFGNYAYISPLTTLAYIKQKNGEDITAFERLVKDFDPVSAYASAEGNDQTQKLLTLMQGLKTSLVDGNVSELASLDISSVVDSSISFNDFNISAVTQNIPASELKNSAEASSKIIKRVLQIIKSIDTNRIDISSFMVNISDGGLNIVDALHNSIKPEVSSAERDAILADNNISTIISKVANSSYSSAQISNMSSYFEEVSHNIEKIKVGDFVLVGFENPFDEDDFLGNSSNHSPLLISDLISGQVTFKDDNNNSIPIPTDAKVRIVPSQFQNDANGWNGLNCNIESNGAFGTECYTDGDESGIRSAFNNTNETYQIVVYKNHIEPDEIGWSCGEDVYNYVGGNELHNSWSSIEVRSGDYEDRSGENCSESLTILKKTGQTQSYDENGTEVTDGSLKDDGFYQKGADTNYTRDNANETVTDHLTGLMWQDDSASVQKPWVTQANYDAGDYNNTTGDTATTYCNELVMGGFEDWRLPTRKELVGIADYGRYDPAINMVFVNTGSNYYWSSTSFSNNNDSAWIVYFSSGTQGDYYKDGNYYVRCVRAGQ